MRSLISAAATRASIPALRGSSEEARLHSHLLPLLAALAGSLSGFKETTKEASAAVVAAVAACFQLLPLLLQTAPTALLFLHSHGAPSSPRRPGAASVARAVAHFLAAAALSKRADLSSFSFFFSSSSAPSPLLPPPSPLARRP